MFVQVFVDGIGVVKYYFLLRLGEPDLTCIRKLLKGGLAGYPKLLHSLFSRNPFIGRFLVFFLDLATTFSIRA